MVIGSDPLPIDGCDDLSHNTCGYHSHIQTGIAGRRRRPAPCHHDPRAIEVHSGRWQSGQCSRLLSGRTERFREFDPRSPRRLLFGWLRCSGRQLVSKTRGTVTSGVRLLSYPRGLFFPSDCRPDDYEIGKLASRGSKPRGPTIILRSSTMRHQSLRLTSLLFARSGSLR